LDLETGVLQFGRNVDEELLRLTQIKVRMKYIFFGVHLQENDFKACKLMTIFFAQISEDLTSIMKCKQHKILA